MVNVNPAAFEILDKSATEVLNVPVFDIFPPAAKATLGDALKQTMAMPEKTKISFVADFNDRTVRTTVSAIFLSAAEAGWVLVLEDTAYHC
jgi:hypothetical protein